MSGGGGTLSTRRLISDAAVCPSRLAAMTSVPIGGAHADTPRPPRAGEVVAIRLKRQDDGSFGLTLVGERPCAIRDVVGECARAAGALVGQQLVEVGLV